MENKVKIVRFLYALLLNTPSLFRPKQARVCPDLLKSIADCNLKAMGVPLQIPQLPFPYYREPFYLEFSSILKEFGNLDLKAVNCYSVAQPEKQSNEWISSFCSYKSRYKDSWFGCYIIFDDKENRGANFILKDSSSSKGDHSNINEESMMHLTAIDQKVIYFSSHTGFPGYSMEQCNKEFYFDVQKNIELSEAKSQDGELWKKVSASAKTLSAFPDVAKTKCGLLNSIRNHCALPSEDDREHLLPWHEITVHGELLARYIENGDNSFWAVVYYNGSEFTTKDGTTINTWSDGSLAKLLREQWSKISFDVV